MSRSSVRVLVLVMWAMGILSVSADESAIAELDPVEAVVPEIELQAEQPDANYRASLKQLGINYTMHLRGVEGSDSVAFDVRADQVVTGAQLDLEYSYSPALLEELSQINVLVNDQLAASLPVPKDAAGTLQRQTVSIPPQLITEFNRLSLQLIGHYTMGCEDPMHSSLWAKVSNSSELQLATAPLILPNDLAKLPQPFFDSRDSRLLELPFVFAGEPDARTLEAAGAVASWFGALASYRGARFPVSLGQLPAKGNAIVWLNTPSSFDALVGARSDGASLTVVAHPGDPYGKLLLISGADTGQLKQAALALVTGSQVMTGAQARIRALHSAHPRRPYDAPNWLPSDRPVKLSELVAARALSVSGVTAGPINIPLRLPPDLFNWREKGVPLHLRYRYTPQPNSKNSALVVSAGGRFIKSEPLPSREQLQKDLSILSKLGAADSLLREVDLKIPLETLPLQTALQLHFLYDLVKEGECREVLVDSVRGTIEPDSTLDLSGYKHFLAMPNLGVFSNSGFPFTRMADLADTAVVLSDAAPTAELSLYLELMGRFGESTGIPATSVSVADGRDDAQLRDKDLLVLSTEHRQPLLKRWADHIPANLEGQAQFSVSDLVYRVGSWLGTPQSHSATGRVELSSGAVGAYLAGFESPLTDGRSVVVLAAESEERLAEIGQAMRGGEGYEQTIQGSLAVINGKRISSLVADVQYYVGDLGWLRYWQWRLAGSLLGMLVFTGLCVVLLTLVMYVSLRARARQRLNG